MLINFIGLIQLWCVIHRERTTRVCDVTSSVRRSAKRRIAQVSRRTVTNAVYHGRLELDLHADTIVFGKNFAILQYTERECDVSPYTDAYEAIKNVPIVSGGTAYTSQTFILVFHEGLWMGDQMENSLLNPNQLRHFGVTVQDNPFSPVPLHMATEDSSFIMPLAMLGTIVTAQTRTPTQEELDTCRKVVLSSKHPWDPHSVTFPVPSRSVEEEMVVRNISTIQTDHGGNADAHDDETVLYSARQHLAPHNSQREGIRS